VQVPNNSLIGKIQNATVQGSVDLCATCRSGIRRRSALTGATETRCDAFQGSPLVRTQIAECNRYIEIGTLSLCEMSAIAWIVEARGKQIGFLSPEELARRQQNPAQVPGPSIGFK